MFYITKKTIDYRKNRKAGKVNVGDKLNFVLFESDTVLFMVGLLFLYPFYKYSKILFILDLVGNVLSLFYYKLINDKKYYLYSMLSLIQIIFFISFATLILGWNSGFQYYIFLGYIAFFLPFYLPDNLKEKQISRIPIGILLMILYLVLYNFTNITNLSIATSIPRSSARIFLYINFLVTSIIIIAFSYFYSSLIISEKKELSSRADYDELTGLYNRYILNYNLEQYISLASGKEKDSNNLLVAMLDIDFFKKINDTYGHNAGDYILKAVAKRIKKFSKYGIIVGRWGGEEFLFISTSMEKDVFSKKLDELRKDIENTKYKYEGKNIHVTVSIGIGQFKEEMDALALVKSADDNLYKAKESGRNKAVY